MENCQQVTVPLSDAAYAALKDHGYCSVERRNDLVASQTNVGDKVKAQTVSGLGLIMRLVAVQKIGEFHFIHIYAVAI